MRALLAPAITLALTVSLQASSEAQTRRQNKDKPDESPNISILDSSEAQWGMRSVNDSVYQGYPMNAIYLERGRSRLPDSFPKYTPRPLTTDIIIRSSQPAAPTTIRVNGVEKPLESGD